PTRGVDVGARSEIYRVIAELAANGIGIVMVSSELAELPGFAPRVLVVREGHIVDELDGATSTEEDVLRSAVPVHHTTKAGGGYGSRQPPPQPPGRLPPGPGHGAGA